MITGKMNKILWLQVSGDAMTIGAVFIDRQL